VEAMTAPRILIVTRSLPFHALGGMEAVAWDLARAFTRAGCSVKVLTTACSKLPARSVQEGVTIECLPVPSGRYSREWWRASREAFESRYAWDTDIVLSVSAAAMSIASNRENSSPSAKYFVQAHGTAWGEIISKLQSGKPIAWLKSLRNVISLWEDRQYRNFDGFIAVGKAVQKDLSSRPTRWLVGNVPVHLIPNGIDTRLFRFEEYGRNEIRKKYNIGEDACVVMSASRLHRQKGITEAINGFAVAARNHPNLRYFIVGSGPQEKEIRSQIEELGLAKRIVLVGAIARIEMYKFLSAADVFLFTTLRQEGLPLNALEALACGLPCILSEHINEAAFNSLAVRPAFPEDIAKAITQSLAVSRDTRSSLLPSEFELGNCVQAYLAFFKRGGRAAAVPPACQIFYK
jgi:hypothetical protein